MTEQPKPFVPAAGLKQRDLKPCALCGKGMMHKGHPMFYRVTVQSFVVHLRNVQRQSGFEMMMGDAASLADVMGPNNDMAQAPCPANEALVCMDCALGESMSVSELLERIGDKE